MTRVHSGSKIGISRAWVISDAINREQVEQGLGVMIMKHFDRFQSHCCDVPASKVKKDSQPKGRLAAV